MGVSNQFVLYLFGCKVIDMRWPKKQAKVDERKIADQWQTAMAAMNEDERS